MTCTITPHSDPESLVHRDPTHLAVEYVAQARMADLPNEPMRLATLISFGILDTPSEARFDALAAKASRLMGMPIALISLIDSERQWFKARVGIEAHETPRSISFCTHAICGPEVFVVQDACRDERFAANPLVLREPHIRFYAGAPLTAVNGMRIGTLCVIDRRAHPALTEVKIILLEALAGRVMLEMEARAFDKPMA